MKISLLGTGLMGYPMAEKLIETDHEVTVYNRTQEKAMPLAGKGATVANTSAEAIENSQCIILMLADAPAIQSTLFTGNLADKTIFQMGTILPAESKNFSEKVQEQYGEYLECPVLGSIPQVKLGKLILMVGSTCQQYLDWRDFLSVFGECPMRVGEVGKAAALKLALNQLIASMTAAFSLSLGIVQKENIDVEIFMNILRRSALYSPQFDKKLSRFSERNFSNPNFPTRHLLKDAQLILTEAEALQLETAMLEGVRDIIRKTIKMGFSDTDYSSIYNGIVPE